MFWSRTGCCPDRAAAGVNLPEYYDGCYDDASLGINPDMTYDCDWAPAHI